MRVGETNTSVTEVMNRVAQSYECNVLEGVLSHQLKHHVIDGNQVIIGTETFDQRVEEFVFGANEAYALDVIVSTGEGKPRESEFRPTVFKRALETTYNLKLKGSRQFLAEVN